MKITNLMWSCAMVSIPNLFDKYIPNLSCFQTAEEESNIASVRLYNIVNRQTRLLKVIVRKSKWIKLRQLGQKTYELNTISIGTSNGFGPGCLVLMVPSSSTFSASGPKLKDVDVDEHEDGTDDEEEDEHEDGNDDEEEDEKEDAKARTKYQKYIVERLYHFEEQKVFDVSQVDELAKDTDLREALGGIDIKKHLGSKINDEKTKIYIWVFSKAAAHLQVSPTVITTGQTIRVAVIKPGGTGVFDLNKYAKYRQDQNKKWKWLSHKDLKPVKKK